MRDRLHEWQKKAGALIPDKNTEFNPWSRDHKERGFQPWN